MEMMRRKTDGQHVYQLRRHHSRWWVADWGTDLEKRRQSPLPKLADHYVKLSARNQRVKDHVNAILLLSNVASRRPRFGGTTGGCVGCVAAVDVNIQLWERDADGNRIKLAFDFAG